MATKDPVSAGGMTVDAEERPLASYALLLAAHVGLVGSALVLAHRRGRLPGRLGPADLAAGAVATYKLSRLVTRSSVAGPLRAPFSRGAEPAGPAEVVEDVDGQGLRKAVGELLTCPFCFGHWVATGYCLGLAFAPEITRTTAAMLCIDAGADLLHHGHARLNG